SKIDRSGGGTTRTLDETICSTIASLTQVVNDGSDTTVPIDESKTRRIAWRAFFLSMCIRSTSMEGWNDAIRCVSSSDGMRVGRLKRRRQYLRRDHVRFEQ